MPLPGQGERQAPSQALSWAPELEGLGSRVPRAVAGSAGRLHLCVQTGNPREAEAIDQGHTAGQGLVWDLSGPK